MQNGSEIGFDWGVISPLCYGVSSVWMLVAELDVVKPQETTLLATFVATIPGILLGIGTILQAISLAQHRRDKLKQESYLRELEIRLKQ